MRAYIAASRRTIVGSSPYGGAVTADDGVSVLGAELFDDATATIRLEDMSARAWTVGWNRSAADGSAVWAACDDAEQCTGEPRLPMAMA